MTADSRKPLLPTGVSEEMVACADKWRAWAFEWSGSAFVAGEKLPKDGMTDAEHKSELYSGLCSLGNHMQWLHCELAALSSQHAEAVQVGEAMSADDPGEHQEVLDAIAAHNSGEEK